MEPITEERLAEIIEAGTNCFKICVPSEGETMARELQQRRQADGWIPVQERMPADTKAVLVRCPERKNTYTACWRVPYWIHFGGASDWRVSEDVTHWRPLPAPEGTEP